MNDLFFYYFGPLNTLRKDRLYSLSVVCQREFLHFLMKLNKDVQQ